MRNSKNSVLAIYAKFMDGQLVKKTEEAKFYGVHERSILRDIHDIRDFLVSLADQNDGEKYYIRYIRPEGGYRMEKENNGLTSLELLQLYKKSSDNQVFFEDKLKEILNKPAACCASQNSEKP